MAAQSISSFFRNESSNTSSQTRKSVKHEYQTGATIAAQMAAQPAYSADVETRVDVRKAILAICAVVFGVVVLAYTFFGPGLSTTQSIERTAYADAPAIVPTATSREVWGNDGCYILPVGIYPQADNVSYYQIGGVATLQCPRHIQVTNVDAFDIAEHVTGKRPETLQ